MNKCDPKDIGYGCGKKYYFKCPKAIHQSEAHRILSITRSNSIVQCKQCASFYTWCLVHNQQSILDRWDYKLNKDSPTNINAMSKKTIFFTCPKNIHKSVGYKLMNLTQSNNIVLPCKQCNSFGQWCVDNNRYDLIKLWDNDLNIKDIFSVQINTNHMYYFKCSRGIHKSTKHNLTTIVNSKNHILHCKKCCSFAQYLLDTYGESALNLYWNYKKNKNINPWKIGKCSIKKVWIKCQEHDYHGSYYVSCSNFHAGKRCPYCYNFHGKVHPLDSLGAKYPQVLKIWSDKNKKSPYEYAPRCTHLVWWKCQNNKHKDYLRRIDASYACNFNCPECDYSKGEQEIRYWLNTNQIIFKAQKSFDNLVGLKNGLLTYDFYLPTYNFLIEYQGEQHDHPVDFKHLGKKKTLEEFEHQKEHDRRKRQYAKDHNIDLLEIWYWDYDNIEKILNNKLRRKK